MCVHYVVQRECTNVGILTVLRDDHTSITVMVTLLSAITKACTRHSLRRPFVRTVIDEGPNEVVLWHVPLVVSQTELALSPFVHFNTAWVVEILPCTTCNPHSTCSMSCRVLHDEHGHGEEHDEDAKLSADSDGITDIHP